MAESRNQILKSIFARRNATLIPGAFNALTAKMIDDAGFEAVYVTGAGLTNAYLGVPDLGLISLSELATNVSAMRDVTDLPIVADGDTGFGNAVNLTRTVRVLERAGANGIQLEDQVFPKKCGHFAGKAVISAEEAVQKIRAAVDARRDPDFTIIARTDARSVLGFEAALDRAHSFIEAGADVTFVESPTSLEEIETIAKLPVPQVVNMVLGGKTPIIEQADLAKLGIGIVLYANAPLQSAMLAVKNTLDHLKASGSTTGYEANLMPFDERQVVVNKAAYDAIEARYAVAE
ncbi:MAG TPA: oxaloacetate decarboxylase [Planctomycetaceae bacterium]|jgi:2-methylisocitrate lyase-like PEP mutase family enzyme|nr:oxaloacetate decarboxylase [Planctomycetaceae bacterium]